MKLNKEFFKRNRDREERGSFFRNSSLKLSQMVNIFLTVVITPAMITSSLLSPQLFFFVANIFLCLGYLTNFTYQGFIGNLSNSDLLLTSLFILSAALSINILLPMSSAMTLASALSFFNHLAICINSYFIAKPFVMLSINKALQLCTHLIGLDVIEDYYKSPKLSLEKDKANISVMFHKHYSVDYIETLESPEKSLKPFQLLVTKLTDYLNKYNNRFLGSIRYQNEMTNIENSINSILTDGDTVSSYKFIRKKIQYKRSKISDLNHALTICKQGQNLNHDDALNKYFNHIPKNTSKPEICAKGTMLLEQEIERQQNKIDSLLACMPN